MVLGLLVVFIRASKLREAQDQNDPRKENIAESPERTHGFERHEVEWGVAEKLEQFCQLAESGEGMRNWGWRKAARKLGGGAASPSS